MADDPDGADVARDFIADLASLPAPRTGPKKSAGSRVSRRKPGDMEPLGDVVADVAGQFGWQLSLHTVQAAWPDIVSDVNAQHSRPERLADTVLTVRADSSAWASALRLMAPQLVAKLNAALGDGSVTRVDILGPSGPTWKHGPKSVRDGRGPRDTYA